MTGALEAAGIPYMLTGSFASSYHGLPRATQDIDIVISPTADQVRALVRMLPGSEYYIDENAAVDALLRYGQFNVIDLATGWKVDFIIRKTRPFSCLEFDRRSEIEFQGTNLVVATAEDVVIAKLEWAKLGQSQRQIEDVSGILKIRSEELDLEYIGEWVEQLQLSEQWKEACRLAGIDERA
jgi:hypothetical protein